MTLLAGFVRGRLLPFLDHMTNTKIKKVPRTLNALYRSSSPQWSLL